MNDTAQDVERLLGEMRPKLHRYCARMTGSVIDGEDIVHDAPMNAFVARASAGVLDNPRSAHANLFPEDHCADEPRLDRRLGAVERNP